MRICPASRFRPALKGSPAHRWVLMIEVRKKAVRVHAAFGFSRYVMQLVLSPASCVLMCTAIAAVCHLSPSFLHPLRGLLIPGCFTRPYPFCTWVCKIRLHITIRSHDFAVDICSMIFEEVRAGLAKASLPQDLWPKLDSSWEISPLLVFP